MIDVGGSADAEFFALFAEEASERLDDLVNTLLTLENGCTDAAAINSLFRDVHSIKGGAGMLGLVAIRDLAHAMEEVLAKARSAGRFPQALVGTLLRGSDVLRRYVAGDDTPEPDLLGDLTDALATVFDDPERGDEPLASVPVQPAEDRRAIRVAPQKIDRLLDIVGETVLHRRRLEHAVGNADDRNTDTISDELDRGGRLFDELKDAAVRMRMLPLATITAPLPRAVREIAIAEGKDIELTISGETTEFDRIILESLFDPLVHVVRNAIGHGVETPAARLDAGKPTRATIDIHAMQRGAMVEIVVSDDGRGVSPELLAEAERHGSLSDLLARPGFSTASGVTDLAGRGVGLDAVKQYVQGFGGTLEARSVPGQGTAITLVLPLALALLKVLLVERGGRVFGIPLSGVEEAITADSPLSLEGRPSLELRGRTLRLTDLADLISVPAPPLAHASPAIVVSSGATRVAAVCDRLLGQDEVVVKPVGMPLAAGSPLLGASILGDGRIALVLDPARLCLAAGALRTPIQPVAVAALSPKILVVEDSLTIRDLQRGILQAAGYRVEVASDGSAGLALLSKDPGFDLVITDVDMPRLTGLELTRAIRARAESASLPVVIVTSLGTDDDRRAGLEAGADAYLVKQTFNESALLATVERLVGT